MVWGVVVGWAECGEGGCVVGGGECFVCSWLVVTA